MCAIIDLQIKCLMDKIPTVYDVVGRYLVMDQGTQL